MTLVEEFLKSCDNVSPLAKGGQKIVLSATHDVWGQIVVKYGEYRFANSLERISREIQILRELKSQYYPTNYEFLIDAARREFLIVEERIIGFELSAVADRFSSDEKILNLLCELVRGLELLWERNIVHRDIKPANILINSEDQPRIIDLGIARFLDEISLTQTFADRGPATPIYASPEQLKNNKTMINHRTDFFLLGLLVLELMLGFHPFDPQHVGNQESILDNILAGNHVPLELSDRNNVLVGFVQNVLAVQPYQRFRTSKDLKIYLRME